MREGRANVRRDMASKRMTIDAGDFDHWLRATLTSFRTGKGVRVPCGDCRGCCSAGRFVHVLPSDVRTREAVPARLLVRAPGMPKGHALLGYTDGGLCPMLDDGNCAIYSARPSTCRAFDCRVLAAAGLQMEGEWGERIDSRVRAWRFAYATPLARRRHLAIRRTVAFLRTHAALFPDGRVPTQPMTLAALAIRVHHVLLEARRGAKPEEIARRMVEASRERS